VYRWHRRAVRRSEGSTTTSQRSRSKRDRDTEPDLIRNQDILRMKDFHHKEIAKKLRDGFRGLREKRKELNYNFKGNRTQHRGERWGVGRNLQRLCSRFLTD
jgi:hypothetical protein